MRITTAILFLWFVFIFTSSASAQLAIRQGKWSLEFSGYVNTMYNYRFYEEGDDDHKKNRFRVSDARLTFDMDYDRRTNAQIQLDFGNQPTNHEPDRTLVDAWLQLRGDWYKLRFGQQKVPYSLISLTNKPHLAFEDRPMMIENMIARRDIGMTFHQFFQNDRLLIWQGIYTGNGRNQKDDDAEGQPLYVGRIQYSYPMKSGESEFDENISHKPILAIGINGTYSEDGLNISDENLSRNIEGKKTLYGMDVSLAYQGIKLLWEFHRADYEPMIGKDYSAGGSIFQGTYYAKPIFSLFAVRYEMINPHTLIEDDDQNSLDVAYTYIDPKLPVRFRFCYYHRFELPNSSTRWKDPELQGEMIFIF